MALPSATSMVSITGTMTVTDLNTSVQLLNHAIPNVNCKASNVQYQGYISIPTAGSVAFNPVSPVISWAVMFVRNLGGMGSGNVAVQATPTSGSLFTVANVEVGGVFLYIAPQLSGVIVNSVQGGYTSMILNCATTTAANVEVLLAG